MNLFRVTALFLFLSTTLVACDRAGLDSSKKSNGLQQSEADGAAQKVADAMNENNAFIETNVQASASMDGKLFKADLLSAINYADEIIITEHSNKHDYSDPDEQKVYQGPVIQYGQVELSAKQKSDFSATISELPNDTQDAFAACIFDPHHSIQFYSGGKLQSTMEICFMCGQIEWTGSSRTPPWSIYSGLSRMVKSVGLSPERDWRKLAKPHRNK